MEEGKFETIKNKEAEEMELKSALFELIEMKLIPFNENFTQIEGEEILETSYFHPGLFTVELKDQINQWDIRKQFLHLGDKIFYHKNEFSYLISKGFNEEEVIKRGRGESLSQDYTNQNGVLTPVPEFAEALANTERSRISSLERFSSAYMLMKAPQSTFMLHSNYTNNNYHMYPRKLQFLDNTLHIIRTGVYNFYKFPEDFYDELKDRPIVSGIKVDNKYIFDQKYEAVKNGTILKSHQYPGKKYGEI